MSEHAATPGQPGEPELSDQPASVRGTEHESGQPSPDRAEPAHERVALGLAAALVALLLGAGLTLAIWNWGFIASITSFVMAAGAMFFYGVAAGAPPRKGIIPLVLLVVVSVIATFFVLVGWDAAQAYDELSAGVPADQVAMSKSEFVRESIFDGEVLGAYSKDMLFFFGFAILGMWTTLKNVLGGARD